jgi:hypothetical protein
LAFLEAAINGSTKYNLGTIIARRLAANGPIYGGVIATRILRHYGLLPHPDDVVLVPRWLDLAAMKVHYFVTNDSTLRRLTYRLPFADNTETEVPLPLSNLFDLQVRPLNVSKERTEEQINLVGFHVQHDPQTVEDDGPHYNYTYYPEASSSMFPDQGATSSYHGGWPSWE